MKHSSLWFDQKEITMLGSKRIIIAPLHWGLGHATRCVPIIQQLLVQKNKVAIASDGQALEFLKTEFPELTHFELPGYNIHYSTQSMAVNMMLQAPKIARAVINENRAIKKLAKKWRADIIISDNRLGCKTDFTENIFITHQIRIPARSNFVSSIASKIHQYIITKYDQCWIPDYEGEQALAGKLSQVKLPIPQVYLGPLSRMIDYPMDMVYDYTAILSGPEPQRSYLENILVKLFNQREDLSLCIVRGTNDKPILDTKGHISVYNLTNTTDLNKIIQQSDHIICRSGYTSIMDLVSLNKGATLIPTPGQYEQEYLGQRLDGKFGFRTIAQKRLMQSSIQEKLELLLSFS